MRRLDDMVGDGEAAVVVKLEREAKGEAAAKIMVVRVAGAKARVSESKAARVDDEAPDGIRRDFKLGYDEV